MVKDTLLKKEPLVYACLHNDLKEDRLSHSYLFCGEKSPLKLNAAYLLAQSIIEGNNDFACESCKTCLRIKNNAHLDVLFIDGKDEIIKKESIDEVLNEFSKTAVEKTGKKVYIINNINNASVKVLNMILKFMEEPSNENTYGIFISDDVNGLLETIVSRCEKLNFISVDYSEVYDEYINNDVEPIDAYILSRTIHEYIEDKDSYITAKDYVINIIENLNDPYYIPVLLFKDLYPLKDFKEISEYMYQIMIQILDDSIACKETGIEEYDDLLRKVKNDSVNLLEIFMDSKAKLDHNASLDHKLLFDEICCRIIEYRK